MILFPGMVEHACKLSIWENEAGGLTGVWGQFKIESSRLARVAE